MEKVASSTPQFRDGQQQQQRPVVCSGKLPDGNERKCVKYNITEESLSAYPWQVRFKISVGIRRSINARRRVWPKEAQMCTRLSPSTVGLP